MISFALTDIVMRIDIAEFYGHVDTTICIITVVFQC